MSFNFNPVNEPMTRAWGFVLLIQSLSRTASLMDPTAGLSFSTGGRISHIPHFGGFFSPWLENNLCFLMIVKQSPKRRSLEELCWCCCHGCWILLLLLVALLLKLWLAGCWLIKPIAKTTP
jgi:hypothetical protein